MRRLLLVLSFLMISLAVVFAQAPEKMTYQAVVRNNANILIANQNVTVRISVLQGSAQGEAVYVEHHSMTTNANGLITVEIGGGSPTTGVFSNIEWSAGPYFLKSEIDPEGGINYTIESVQQLLSVPYALYAKEAGNGFSGDYNDLTNVPTFTESQILSISHDTIYLTGGSFVKLPAGFDGDYNSLTNKPNLFSGAYNDLTGKPNLAPVATSGAYSDLTGQPTIPAEQVNSDWNATSGKAQIFNKPTLFSGNYNDLTNKPTLFDGNYNSLSNRPILFSGNYNDLTNKPTLFDGNYNSLSNRPNLSAVALSGSYNDLINKPALFDGNYNSLSNRPNLAPVATSGSYGDLINKPNLATVATSGSYNDLSNRPAIPAEQVNSDWNATSGKAQIINRPNLAPVATSGNYNDLTNKPTIPTVPTNVSAFNNDAGYLTSFTESQILSISNDTIYLTGGSFVKLPAGFDGDYNSLTNKPNLFSGNYNDLNGKPNLSPVATSGSYNDLNDLPTIPTVPNDVSAFNNDVGYITQTAVPTNVSQLSNDAGYLTHDSLPTNVSAFANDAGYLTSFTESQILSISNDTIYLTGGSFVKLPAGFDGDYNSLTNKPNLFSGNYNDLNGKPNLSPVATSGSYNDLNDLPTIPTVPNDVSAFNNDAGYITQTAVPTNVSQLSNDAGYLTHDSLPTNVSAFTNDAGYLTSFTESQILSISNDTIYLTGGSFVKLPASFDGDYNSLTNKPNLFSGAYNDLTGKPDLAPVATSGNYNDLTNKPVIPTVPTDVSAFNNDAGYLTSFTESQILSISNDTIYLTGGSFVKLPAGFDGDYNSLTNKPNLFSGNYSDLNGKPNLFSGAYNDLTGKPDLAPVATSGNYNDLTNKPNLFSGDYNDLSNKPTIPNVPTDVSAFTNDAGYITHDSLPTNVSAFANDAGYLTSFTESQILSISNDTIYLTGGSFVKLPAGFDGDYNSLTNKPTIPTVPADVSAFNNDAGYLTSFTESQILSISHDTIYLTGGSFVKLPAGFDGDYNSLANKPNLFSGNYSDLNGKPDLAPVATSGNYNDLTNKPNLFSGDYNSLTNKPNLFSGNYNDLTNKPVIPTVPTDVSAFNNDAGYLTSFTESQILSISNDTIYLTGGSFVKLPAGFDGDYNSLTNKPNLFSGNYNDLNGKPNLFSGAYNDLTGKPDLAPVATSGNYNDLTNKPDLFSGDYNDLTNKPVIPTVPTDVSAFNNDAGYLTSFTESQILSISNDTIYLTGGSFVKLPAGFDGDYNSLTNKPNLFSGDYNDLTNKPTIPTLPTNVSAFNNDAGYITRDSIPTNVSAFTNDAGYLTSFTESQILSISNDTIYLTGGSFVKLPAGFDGDYNSLTNKPTIPTVPTDVSVFNNDAHYITKDSIPTNVSVFTNDAGYLTSDSLANLNNQLDSLQQALENMQQIVGGDNFVCGTSTVSDHEGNVYHTVKIGNQCWTKENLRTTTSPTTGTYLIPDANVGPTFTGKQARWYNNDSTTYASMKYGLLYNWNAAVDTFNTAYEEASVNTDHNNSVSVSFTGHRRGICPAGWHLPSDTEWTAMIDYVGSRGEYSCGDNSRYIAKALADSTGWSTYNISCAVGNGLSTNNATGFSALPTGYFAGAYNHNSSYYPLGRTAYFWSANQNNVFTANYRDLYYCNAHVNRSGYYKSSCYSVRCLCDYTTISEQIEAQQNVLDSLASVAFSGDYNDLVNAPAIPQTLADVTANGNSAGNRQLKDVSDPTESYDAVNLRTLTMMLDSMRADFQRQIRQQQEQIDSLRGRIGELEGNTNSSVDGQPCPGTPTVNDIDGNVYNTVQIGGQCWMKMNLRTTHYADGTAIPLGSTTSSENPLRYAPNNNENNVLMRGYLYNWLAVMGGRNSSSTNPSGVQGVCPTGWHVPSDAEWEQLTNYVSSQSQYVCGGDNTYIAKALANTVGWSNNTNICVVGNTPNNNNATGFSVFPAGFYNGSYNLFSGYAYFWSATEESGDNAYYRYLGDNNAFVNRDNSNKHRGYSVRCLRDENVGGNTTQSQPTATTSAVSNVTATSATLNGSVSNPDNVAITAQGFEWKDSTSGTYIQVATTGDTMYYNLTGLSANTSYTYRTFVTTENGTIYGAEVSFTTSSASASVVVDAKSCPSTPTVTDHEGNVYATVQIGSQCWMRENLRTTTSPSTGTYLIPAADIGYTYTGKQAHWYNNDSTTYAPMKYGLLYNWNAAVDAFNASYGETSVNTDEDQAVTVIFSGQRRGICPEGWHLPSYADWTALTDYVGSQSEYTCRDDNTYFNVIAKALASTEGWQSNSGECNPGDQSVHVNNATGFSVVPAGDCYASSFSGAGSSACFWSSSQEEGGVASSFWAWTYFLYGDPSVYMYYDNLKVEGHSVRCLRDENGGGSTTQTQPIGDSQSCPDTLTVTDHEGNVYHTVKVGNQCWTRENLRTTTSPTTGTYLIPVAGTGETYTGKQARWYNDDSTTYAPMNYGLLYNWNAAVDTFNTAYGETSVNTSSSNAVSVSFTGHRRGICPVGWHLPCDTEWAAMTDYVSSQSEYQCDSTASYIAKALADTTGWDTSSNSCAVGNDLAANNATGFSALPAGYGIGSCFGADYCTYFWSATQYSGLGAYYRGLDSGYARVRGSYNFSKTEGFSVRCLRD